MKKVLVTGASGFVGSHVVKLLAERNISVLAVARNDDKAKRLFDKYENIHIIKCNMENYLQLPDLVSEHDIDTIYHFAWEGTSGEIRKDYNIQLKNVVAVCDLLKAARSIGCKRVVCAGSIMEQEVIEATKLQGVASASTNVYAAAKCVSHQMAKAVADEMKIDLIWGIITNAYGPGELSERFINTTLRKILNREELKFTVATQNYDFIYIADLARAFLAIGERGKADSEYVLGSGQARPLKSFILEMIDMLAPGIPYTFGTAPFSGISLPLEAFDTRKTEEDTEFQAQVPFAAGICATMEWISTRR